MTTQLDVQHFEQILEYLEQARGFDFTAYKRSSLMRRILKRMQAISVSSFEEYFDYLQVHQDEFDALFDTILINVTSFFRDPDVWDYIRTSILPKLAVERGSTPLRIWSAGSASGQEAYTAVMLLAELIGVDGVRERVKVYATDVDEGALSEARAGTYTARAVESVPQPLLERYFESAGSNFVFNRELRRSVIFGRHDLIQDAPISRVDLLLCRNTLMYFNSDAQARMLSRFYFSLNPGGHIVLGRAEMLFSHTAMFTPVDLKRRVFRAVPKPTDRDRLLLFAHAGQAVLADEISPDVRLREAAFESNDEAVIVMDETGALAAANATARERFGLTPLDIGRALQDLDISYRPAELRGAVHRALEQRQEVRIADVHNVVNGSPRVLEILVKPLADDKQAVIGTRVLFRDVTELCALQLELQHSKQELETAYEELQSTNEELETTNEELQSTVEELETTNEELQSTNEELETMNEELQSTNEELQSINEDLRHRGTDLNAANAFLESVFASMRSAVVVLDRDFRVKGWNDRSTDLWGARAEEVRDAHFLNLDIGLPLVDLTQPVRDVLSGVRDFDERIVPATNRRGRTFQCRINIGPLRYFDAAGTGVILLMEEHTDTPES